jgi:hypothetical protein
MVFCRFCHWTKVEPGRNCPRCNTYMPKESSDGGGSRPSRFGRSSVRRRAAAEKEILAAKVNRIPEAGHLTERRNEEEVSV